MTRHPSSESPHALVTGANRGLGLETCRQLGQRGYRVTLTARNEATARDAAARLAIEGLAVRGSPLDVTSPASIAALRNSLAENSIDALVNNAAVALDGFDADVAQRTIDANFRGAARVTDALWPLVRHGGRIVMVSSGLGQLSCLSDELARQFADHALTRTILDRLVDRFIDDVAAGRHSSRGWPSSAYNVSKVALNALTRLLAANAEARGLKINAVCPGWVRTDMGGRGATRNVAEGARGIVWAATLSAAGPNGRFFRDGAAIGW